MKALYYFQWIMVVVYLGLGLLLLFSPPDNLLANPAMRKGLGGIMLVYGLFRGFQNWQKRKGNDKDYDY